MVISTGGDANHFNTFAGNAQISTFVNGVEQPRLRANLSDSPSFALPFTGQAANLPPYWESTVGLTAVDGITGGLRLHFGRALDPEGAAVSYVLRYVQGAGPVGSA